MKPSKEELIQQGVSEDIIETIEINRRGLDHIVLEGYLTEDEPPVRLWRILEAADDDYQDYLDKFPLDSKYIKVEYEEA